MKIVQDLSELDLPNKLQFIATLHSSIGNAHLELGHEEQALEHFNKDMEIAEAGYVEYNMCMSHCCKCSTPFCSDYVDARARALYNLGRVHSMMGEYEKALEL